MSNAASTLKLRFNPIGTIFTVVGIGFFLILLRTLLEMLRSMSAMGDAGSASDAVNMKDSLVAIAAWLFGAAVAADSVLRRATLLLTSDRIQQRVLWGLQVISWHDVQRVDLHNTGIRVFGNRRRLTVNAVGHIEYEELMDFMERHLPAPIAKSLRSEFEATRLP